MTKLPLQAAELVVDGFELVPFDEYRARYRSDLAIMAYKSSGPYYIANGVNDDGSPRLVTNKYGKAVVWKSGRRVCDAWSDILVSRILRGGQS